MPRLATASRLPRSGNAALASGAPADGNVFTFKAEDRDVKVTLNQQNLVEKVEYLTTNSVVGDVPVELTYADYA